MHWLCDHNAKIRIVALKNAPTNLKLTSPNIKNDIVSVVSFETMSVIVKDIGNVLFSKSS